MKETEEQENFSGSWWRYAPLRNALLSGVIIACGFALAHMGLIPEHIERIFYWTAIPIGGWHWGREGLEKLFKEKEVGIEILMMAATVGCGLLGLWDEAAALVFLYGAAEGTEEYTYARTRASIRALLDLAPKEARVLRSGKEVTIPAEELKIGDCFVVRPGEALPTDGVIRSGESSLDESPVTGESVPVDKGPGAKVFAASINRQGALEVEATAAFADNTLAKIIHLVEEAQEQKGQGQQWIDRFGRYYSPAVIVGAALLLLLPWLMNWPLDAWYLRAVLLLVAAAPCALIMSMPVAMAAGIGIAGRRGILIKGGAHLEHLGLIRLIAFDKTGTLTKGSPTVTEVIAWQGSETEILAAAAALEHYSEHPLGYAIREKASERGLTQIVADNFKALTGAGVKAQIGSEIRYVGNPDLFQKLGFDLSDRLANIYSQQEQGRTVVLIGKSAALAGMISLQDSPRPGVKDAIAALHAAGYRTAMLSGDSERTANAVAAQLGIKVVHADLKPDEKVTAIDRLIKDYGHVLMVGDGVNDAPALAAATCGVAMGAAGTDAAIEAADVALMTDDISRISEALRLGKKARRVSAQNIIFSMLVLATLIPLALTGTIGMTMTVLMHEVSELLAVVNGLRVARLK